MIGQYLSNTNENATMFILQKILQLNKAPLIYESLWCGLGFDSNNNNFSIRAKKTRTKRSKTEKAFF
jgi:hypothetical protein